MTLKSLLSVEVVVEQIILKDTLVEQVEQELLQVLMVHQLKELAVVERMASEIAALREKAGRQESYIAYLTAENARLRRERAAAGGSRGSASRTWTASRARSRGAATRSRRRAGRKNKLNYEYGRRARPVRRVEPETTTPPLREERESRLLC